MAIKPAGLHDEDFYAGPRRRRRRCARTSAATIASMSSIWRRKSRIWAVPSCRAVESFVEQIIANLLKLDYSGQDAPRPHWRAEVLNFRRSAGRKISPTIRRKVESELDELYEGGRQIAAVGALPHEPDLARRLPKTCPYDRDVIWHRDVMAEAGLDLFGNGEAPKKRRRKRGA
jgi:hypothetical protein